MNREVRKKLFEGIVVEQDNSINKCSEERIKELLKLVNQIQTELIEMLNSK